MRKIIFLISILGLYSFPSHAFHGSDISDDDSEFSEDDVEVLVNDDDDEIDFLPESDDENSADKTVISYQGLSLKAFRDVYSSEAISQEDKNTLIEHLSSFYSAAMQLEELYGPISSPTVLEQARRFTSTVKNQGQAIGTLLESESFNIGTSEIEQCKNRIKDHLQKVNELLEENFYD